MRTPTILLIFLVITTPLFGEVTVHFAPTHTMNPLVVEEPRVEYLQNPEGIDVAHPRFSWWLSGDDRDRAQSAYRILVAEKPFDNDGVDMIIWDSGRVNSERTNQIEYAGPALQSGRRYYWRVRIWDEAHRPSAWSELSHWSMGMLDFHDWQGRFISHGIPPANKDKYAELHLPPARYLRTSFNADKPVRRATVYATARGLYELRLNGEKVGKDYLLPGWTDYDQRLYYHTYDVTDRIRRGENAWGTILADGWYAGYIGYALLVRLDKVREFYGVSPSFMGQMVIEFEDGSREVIATDRDNWKSNVGPIREADLIMGERYDARLELDGWDEPGYDDTEWSRPKLYHFAQGELQAYPGTTLRERERLTPTEITEPEPGVYVFNLGKNVAGIAELKVKAAAGTEIQLRYGEILRDDGNILTANLRKARATDTYVTSGQGIETWRPRFTYHGFQYVEVRGLPEPPNQSTVTGIVLSSIATDASTFSSPNPMNNQLYENIKTTQSANFFEVPTDCPQRDERLGWTGDAQIFARSATFNADVAAFLSKFVIDLEDAQLPYGAYPNFAPFPYSRPDSYSPAWMDAGVIVPYTLYEVYGDTRIIEYAYPGMRKFMDFQAAAAEDYLRPGAGNNYGDWLSVNEKTGDDFIASAYYGYDAALMAEMAEALGKAEDARRYRALFHKIRSAFANRYFEVNGHTTEGTQTSYALALYFNLYPPELAPAGAARLAELIEANGDKFSTGFLGTKHVMLALAKYGYHDLAFRIFQQTKYPSWGFSVVNGSTSIWERWNSYTKDNSQNESINAAMNSFSHYAFGSVAEWMYRYALGIETEGAGYRHLRIAPTISREMDFLEGSYRSINGPIATAWKWEGERITLSVSVPVNTRADIHLPGVGDAEIYESGKLLDERLITGRKNGTVTLSVGSGNYAFTYAVATK